MAHLVGTNQPSPAFHAGGPCRAAADAEREKRSTAVGASTRQLSSRRGGGGAPSPGSSRFPTEGEELEEEDYDKLN